MGVYTANRISSFGGIDPETIVANENYSGAGAAELVLIENYQNDMAMFEAILANDFAEAVAVTEGTMLESELVALTEGALGDFFGKIKEGLKKVWEKIKGIFKTFIAKLSNVVIRDNKKFVEKYKNEVVKKDLSKMTYKWAEKNDEVATYTSATQAVEFVDGVLNLKASIDEVNKASEDFDSEGTLDDMLSFTLGNKVKTTASEYAKDAHEFMFADEEEVEGLSTSRLTDIMAILTSSAKTMKEVNKAASDADKAFVNELKKIDKVRDALLKAVPGKEGEAKEDTEARNLNLAKANLKYKQVQAFQTVATKATGVNIEAVKFVIKQARSVFAKAVAFNPKSVKENAILVEAAAEAAEYEVESLF